MGEQPSGKVSLGQVIDAIGAYLGQIKNLLGAYIIAIIAIVWALTATLGAEQPAWLVGLISSVLACSLGWLVFVLGKAGLTDPNKLLQDRYVEPVEQVAERDYEEELQELMGGEDEEPIDVDA